MSSQSTLTNLSQRLEKDWSFLTAYLISVFVTAICWLLFGMGLAAQAGVTAFAGIVLLRRAIGYSRENNWTLVSIEIFPLTILWLLFGVGGLFALSEMAEGGRKLREYFYPYTNMAAFHFTCYVLAGSIIYSLVVRRSYGKPNIRLNFELTDKQRVHAILLTSILLIFDWYIRLNLIRQGAYFTWLAGGSDFYRGQHEFAIYVLQYSFNYITIPLLIYLSKVSRIRKIYYLLTVFQGILIFLSGQRQRMLMALITAVCAYWFVNQKAITRRFIFASLLGAAITMWIIFPAIALARERMQDDSATLMKRPGSIIAKFALDYIPRSFIRDDRTLPRDLNKNTLEGRIGLYASLGASINQILSDGNSTLNKKAFWPSILLIVPGPLYPNKPVIDADQELQKHFHFSLKYGDLAGTPIVDVFSMLHVLGIISFLAFMAWGAGLFSRFFVNSYGALGVVIIIGFAPNLKFEGDAFGGFLAGLRNFALLYLFLQLLEVVAAYSGRFPKSITRKSGISG